MAKGDLHYLAKDNLLVIGVEKDQSMKDYEKYTHNKDMRYKCDYFILINDKAIKIISLESFDPYTQITYFTNIFSNNLLKLPFTLTSCNDIVGIIKSMFYNKSFLYGKNKLLHLKDLSNIKIKFDTKEVKYGRTKVSVQTIRAYLDRCEILSGYEYLFDTPLKLGTLECYKQTVEDDIIFVTSFGKALYLSDITEALIRKKFISIKDNKGVNHIITINDIQSFHEINSKHKKKYGGLMFLSQIEEIVNSSSHQDITEAIRTFTINHA